MTGLHRFVLEALSSPASSTRRQHAPLHSTNERCRQSPIRVSHAAMRSAAARREMLQEHPRHQKK